MPDDHEPPRSTGGRELEPAGTRELVPGVVVTDDGRIGGDASVGDLSFVEMARFLGDVGRLLWRVARDPRVPWQGKAVAGGAVAYVVSPLDLIPDVIPGVGRLDDLYLVVRALRYLARTAGYDLLHELWPGSEDGFALVLVLAGIAH